MLLVDTSVLFAAADRDDPDHGACAGLLRRRVVDLVAPVPVLVECAWLMHARLGPAAEASFLRSAAAARPARADLMDVDWPPVAELVEAYADLSLGVVDASLMAVAERLTVAEVATLDRRHFNVVRPRHDATFELLP